MNDDLEEIKEMSKRTLALAEDTNRMVHRMRRAAAWGRFFQIVWWVVIIAVSGAAYYYYLAPYVNRLEQLYGQVEGINQQGQNWSTELQQFFSHLTPSQKST
jgi:hypothetical protein